MADLQQQMEALKASQATGSLEEWSPPTSVHKDSEMTVPPMSVSQETRPPSDPSYQAISGTEAVTPVPPNIQETPPPDENQSDLATDSDEEQYVDKELEEEVERQAEWMRKNGVSLVLTAEVGAKISPANPSNQDDIGVEDKDSTPSEVQETPPPADPPNLSDSGAEVHSHHQHSRGPAGLWDCRLTAAPERQR